MLNVRNLFLQKKFDGQKTPSGCEKLGQAAPNIRCHVVVCILCCQIFHICYVFRGRRAEVGRFDARFWKQEFGSLECGIIQIEYRNTWCLYFLIEILF